MKKFLVEKKRSKRRVEVLKKVKSLLLLVSDLFVEF